MKKFTLFAIFLVVFIITIHLFIIKCSSDILLKRNKLQHVKSWLYQLQNADPYEIAQTKFDLVVIDYSRDGTREEEYTKEEIEVIKKSGKIVLAYISIGEAEDYRFYWKEEWYENPPDFIGKENSKWKGNYEVKYWDLRWKKIIFSYLDKIIEQGFDGIYLDKVDAFEYWSNCSNEENFCLPEEEVARRMIEFIEEIVEYCRERRRDFIVIMQNGERLLEYDKNKVLLKILDGIAVEDLFYNGLDRNPEEIIKERLKYIELFKKANKIVLVVDYVDIGNYSDPDNLRRIKDFIERARELGFIPYAARVDRELDEINVIPGVQP